MPRSKRSTIHHLTKTTKKDRTHNENLYNSIREAASSYSSVFVFSVENMRNTYLKDVRSQLSTSRIFFGKTKVMAKALGTTVDEEALPGLSGMSAFLSGNVGLLFTNQPVDEITGFFDEYIQTDYARAGVEATRDFVVPAGIVYSRGGEIDQDEDLPLPHSLEVQLRKCGMPTRLVKGRITLDDDYTVCKQGKELDSHQTALLKTFGVAMAEFRVILLAYVLFPWRQHVCLSLLTCI